MTECERGKGMDTTKNMTNMIPWQMQPVTYHPSAAMYGLPYPSRFIHDCDRGALPGALADHTARRRIVHDITNDTIDITSHNSIYPICNPNIGSTAGVGEAGLRRERPNQPRAKLRCTYTRIAHKDAH